jgi:hypothetical protein
MRQRPTVTHWVIASACIDAAPARVYRTIADYRNAKPVAATLVRVISE